jgi:hypothetical protein
MNRQRRARKQNIDDSKEMTPEMVASMSMEEIRKGLSELGLDPNKPLPERLKRIISRNKTLLEDRERDMEDAKAVSA